MFNFICYFCPSAISLLIHQKISEDETDVKPARALAWYFAYVLLNNMAAFGAFAWSDADLNQLTDFTAVSPAHLVKYTGIALLSAILMPLIAKLFYKNISLDIETARERKVRRKAEKLVRKQKRLDKKTEKVLKNADKILSRIEKKEKAEAKKAHQPEADYQNRPQTAVNQNRPQTAARTSTKSVKKDSKKSRGSGRRSRKSNSKKGR